MDTTKLKVGQDVYLHLDTTFWGFVKAKVSKVTRKSVEVRAEGEKTSMVLDKNGVEIDAGLYERHGFNLDAVGSGSFCKKHYAKCVWYTAPDQGRWRLDGMPFEERTAEIEHTARLLEITKTLVVGQEVWMVSGPYIEGKCFIKGEVVKLSTGFVEVRGEDGELRRFSLTGEQGYGSRHLEFGPWRLDGIPFEERTALLEQATCT